MNTDETGGRDLGIGDSESRNPSEFCAADRERVALLEAFVACAPSEWKAELGSPPDHVWLYPPSVGMTELNLSDTAEDIVPNAEVIILMLDAMEKAGYFPWINYDSDDTILGKPLPGRFLCGICEQDGFDIVLTEDGNTACSGKTRAEAVAKAFVACFSTASQNGLSNAPPATTDTQIPEGEK